MNPQQNSSKKTVSLVLGSGGARGLAHIGVIRWLQQNGFEIQSISGCSIGALIGGVFAAGKLDQFTHWVRAIKALDIVSLLDFSLNRAGLVRGEKIINTLKELVGDSQIEDQTVKFTAVATDIRNGREVWLDRGPLFDAIRASISMPLFFTPVKHGNSVLIDGGVLNPVPIAPTFHDQTDVTIAVNLGGGPELYQEIADSSEHLSVEPAIGMAYFEDKVNSFIRSVLTANVKDSKDDDHWGYYAVANKAFEAMQGSIARQKLAAYPPDVLIEIAASQCSIFEFDRADELIALGHRVAAQRLGIQKGSGHPKGVRLLF